MAEKTNANIGFEKQLWDAACVLWGHIPAAEYRKVIIGLIFLRYISTAFEKRYNQLVAEGDGFEDDRDAYEEENIFFVPEAARWSTIAAAAHTPEIGIVIITFKAETFITLAVIGWTYLLHAYYRSQKIDYRYYKQLQQRKKYDRTKYGAYKYWELERCLNDDHCPLDSETVSNLRFLIGIRHEIEHQMTNKIDEFLSAKLQACAINFDYYIIRLFGRKYSLNKDLSLAIQFSPLSPEQREGLQDNPHITSNIKNFVVDYESDLTDETLKSSRYAYRVLFVPINAKRPGQADRVVEFIKGDSPEAEGIEKAYTYIKETEKPKYRPKEIVNLMKDEGFPKFTISKHTDLWKEKDAKNKKYAYGTEVSGTWYWYGTWLEIVRQYCQDNRDALI